MFDQFCKKFPWNNFYVLLAKILHLEKKHVTYTHVCLSLLSQEKMWLIKMGVGRQGGELQWKWVGGIFEKLHLRGGCLWMEIGVIGGNFS